MIPNIFILDNVIIIKAQKNLEIRPSQFIDEDKYVKLMIPKDYMIAQDERELWILGKETFKQLKDELLNL